MIQLLLSHPAVKAAHPLGLGQQQLVPQRVLGARVLAGVRALAVAPQVHRRLSLAPSRHFWLAAVESSVLAHEPPCADAAFPQKKVRL